MGDTAKKKQALTAGQFGEDLKMVSLAAVWDQFKFELHGDCSRCNYKLKGQSVVEEGDALS
jgi:hypothetical protein